MYTYTLTLLPLACSYIDFWSVRNHNKLRRLNTLLWKFTEFAVIMGKRRRLNNVEIKLIMFLGVEYQTNECRLQLQFRSHHCHRVGRPTDDGRPTTTNENRSKARRENSIIFNNDDDGRWRWLGLGLCRQNTINTEIGKHTEHQRLGLTMTLVWVCLRQYCVLCFCMGSFQLSISTIPSNTLLDGCAVGVFQDSGVLIMVQSI